MSTCISRHGEYGSHRLGEGAERFVCQLCGGLDEAAMLAAIAEAEAKVARVEALLHVVERRMMATALPREIRAALTGGHQ